MDIAKQLRQNPDKMPLVASNIVSTVPSCTGANEDVVDPVKTPDPTDGSRDNSPTSSSSSGARRTRGRNQTGEKVS